MSSTKFVFFGPIGKTRWPPWPLIGWDIFDFSSETAEQNSRTLTGSKISTSSTEFVFFGPIWKTRWPPWPLIGWDIFDFFSEKAEQNSTKLDKKQDLNIFYQVCVFSGRLEKQDGRPGLWLAEAFSTSLKRLNRIQLNLTRSKISTSSTEFVFFRAYWKNKMAALASDWMRHFWLLLWNRWMEFNETWQEARSQHPLPSLCIPADQ